ncbi:Isoniazid-induced protein IniC [compost metagenome]
MQAAKGQNRPLEEFQRLYTHQIAGCVSTFAGMEAEQALAQALFDLERRARQLGKGHHPIRLVVAGEFNAGKSSVINSLIGRELNPVGDEPMTLAPAYFRYGETTRINIEFENGTTEEITLEEFQRIKHPEGGRLPEKYRAIKMINFYYPYAKLAEVHIIDTPGFSTVNGDGEHGDDAKTLRVIEEYADVILWIFDANKGGASEAVLKLLSEVGQRVRLDGLAFGSRSSAAGVVERRVPAAAPDEGRRTVSALALMNRTDDLGPPDTVGHLLAQFSQETSIARVMAYSALQVMKLRHSDWRRDVAERVASDLNGHASLRVERQDVERGIETVTRVTVVGPDDQRLFRKDYPDLSCWAAPLEQLESTLDEIRGRAKALAQQSLTREWQALRARLSSHLEAIEQQVQREGEQFKAGLRALVRYLDISKAQRKAYLQEHERQFARYCTGYLASHLVRIDRDEGFMASGWVLNANLSHDPVPYFNQLFDHIDAESFIADIKSGLSEFNRSQHFKQTFALVEFREHQDRLLSRIDDQIPWLQSELRTMLQAALNIAVQTSFRTAGAMVGRKFDAHDSPERLRATAAEEIYRGSHYATALHWFKNTSDAFHQRLTDKALTAIDTVQALELAKLKEIRTLKDQLEQIGRSTIL